MEIKAHTEAIWRERRETLYAQNKFSKYPDYLCAACMHEALTALHED